MKISFEEGKYKEAKLRPTSADYALNVVLLWQISFLINSELKSIAIIAR